MKRMIIGGLVAVVTGSLAAAVGQATASDAAAVRPVVTKVSPSAGRLEAGTLITVHGVGVGAASRVLFGSASSTTIKRLSATGIVVVAPAHVASQVHIRVVTAAGTSRSADANEYTFRSAPKVVTGTVDKPLPSGVRAAGITCGSLTNCVGLAGVTDDGDHTYDYATHFDGTSWSSGHELGQYFDVTCFPVGTCIAHGRPDLKPRERKTEIFDGTSWKDYSSTVPSSCETFASRYFCLGGTSRSAVVYDHGRAGPALKLVDSAHPLDFRFRAACPSTTTCYVLTYENRIARYTTAGGWGPLRQLQNFNGKGGTLECASSASCVVTGSPARVSYLHDGLWSFAQPIAPGLQELSSLDCPNAHYCVADGVTRPASGGYEVRRIAFDATAVDSVVLETSQFDPAPVPETLSCPVVGGCVALRNDGGSVSRYGVLTA